MVEVKMPRLSESMTEGKLLMWSVAVGDRVEAGDQLAEVEADKANMEIESPVAGVVLNLHGKPGDTMAVGTLLVELREEASSGATSAPAKEAAGASSDVPAGESALERRQKQFSGDGDQ